MKRSLPLFLILSLLLTGCAGPAEEAVLVPDDPTALSPSDVTGAYEAAAQVYDWFDLTTMTLDETDSRQENGAAYYRVAEPDRPGITTLASLTEFAGEHFSPDLTASLLAMSPEHYRDFDGRLYALPAGRETNPCLLDKTVTAEQVDSGHWTVTLTFWADSWESHNATVGYSQTVLDYEDTESGWRFTSFCPSDGLDLEAETVFTFQYDGDGFLNAEDSMETWSDFKLACWLLHADALSEGASDRLSHRLLEDPERWFAALSVFPDSPWKNADIVMRDPAWSIHAWFTEAEQRQFQDILASYQPKNGAEQSLLDGLNTAWSQAVQLHQGNSAFCLAVNDQCLTLGEKTGPYPWSYTGFPEAPTCVGKGDNGEQVYTFSYGGVDVSYCTVSGSGQDFSYVNRMETVSPTVETWWGVSVGDSADDILAVYPAAVYTDRISPEDGDGAWVWPNDEEPLGDHMTFYMRDGTVVKILMEHLDC